MLFKENIAFSFTFIYSEVEMFTLKIGKGRPLRSQTRELIARVIDFMKREAEEAIAIPIANFRVGVMATAGISRNAFVSFSKENEVVNSGEKALFTTPKKMKDLCAANWRLQKSLQY